ncbi:MAG: prepilin-type N-terminal cleavage/methylation domain-containing protein [Candidatus Omnitrophota bacterium]|nr:prepilin-type N-terminal cleavage/methylation domain-containing protein [Candidatus Omnitrophota bacterium]
MRPFLPIWKRSNNSPLKILNIHKKRNRGFTLIELLIVASILAVVMLAIYSSFISGLRLWQRSQNLSQIQRKVIIGLEKISSQVRQSIDFPDIGFNGTKTKFSFPLIIREKDEDRVKEEIAKVTFEFDAEHKSLIRSAERYQDILLEGDGKKVSAQVLIPRIEEANFSYYYFDDSKPDPWKEEWKPEEGVAIPMAVKITIRTKDGNKATTIFVPVSY